MRSENRRLSSRDLPHHCWCFHSILGKKTRLERVAALSAILNVQVWTMPLWQEYRDYSYQKKFWTDNSVPKSLSFHTLWNMFNTCYLHLVWSIFSWDLKGGKIRKFLETDLYFAQFLLLKASIFLAVFEQKNETWQIRSSQENQRILWVVHYTAGILSSGFFHWNFNFFSSNFIIFQN